MSKIHAFKFGGRDYNTVVWSYAVERDVPLCGIRDVDILMTCNDDKVNCKRCLAAMKKEEEDLNA